MGSHSYSTTWLAFFPQIIAVADAVIGLELLQGLEQAAVRLAAFRALRQIFEHGR